MRKVQGIIAALAVGSALVAVSAPAAHGATIVARPVADATVFAGGRVQPAQRFLVVDGRPSAKAFLRWQLPGSLDGLQRATLELYSPTGGRGLRITTGRSPWSERSIRGRKPKAAVLAGTIASARPGSWIRLDVTRFARAGGSLSFVVSKAGSAETRLSSREGLAALRPRIKLFVNTMPGCGDGNQAATEDLPLDLRLSCRDDGALTYRQTTGPAHGALTVAGNGGYRYVPAANFNGTDEFGYEACETGGPRRCEGGRVRIQVAPVNDAPSAVNVAVTTAEETPSQVELKGSDVDGDPISFSLASQPAHGTAVPAGNGATYTPTANYAGPDSFGYVVSDGKGGTAGGVVSVTVTPVNDAPTAGSSNVTVDEDVAKAVTLNGVDVEGDAVSFLIVGQPSHGVLSGSGANRTYTPAADYHGPDSFTYRASDGTLSSELATVAITVGSVNDAPTANAASATTPEDAAVSITLSGGDADGDSISFLVEQPLHGTVSGAGASRMYTPAANYNGPDSFTYRASDGTAQSAPATVSLTVTSVNDAPTAAGQSLGTPEDTAKALTLNGTDVDGDAVTFLIVGQPTNGVLSGSGADRTYTPAANYDGPDSFTYRASDGTLSSELATVAITVGSVNDAPTANAVPATTAEDTPVSITLSGGDADGDSISFLVEQPLHGTVSGTGASRTYTPAANYNGPDSFTYRANDGTAQSAPATVSLTVTSVNDAPTAAGQSLSTPEDTAKALTLNGTDVDGDAVTFLIVGQPTNGVLSGTGANRTYTPAADYNGDDSFTYRASDGTLTSELTTVSIAVAAVNDAPVAVNVALATPEDTPKVLTLEASDVDSTLLTYSIVDGPDHGTLSGSGADRTYTPAVEYSGPDSFRFRANDGAADSNIATITISVGGVNDPPSAADVSVSTLEDTPRAVDLSGSDPEGEVLSFSIVSNPAHGTLSGSGAGRTYTPAPDYFGPDSFRYRTNDGELDSSPATVSITVSAVNDPPTAVADARNATEDTALVFNASTLTTNDAAGPPNEAGQTLAVVAVSGMPAAQGAVVLNGGGNITYTPAPNFAGPANFDYTLRDNGETGGAADPRTATGTVQLSVANVNDAPLLNATGTPTLTAIAEDATNSSGDAIPAVLARGFGGDPISDADGAAQEGIAVTAAQTANGTWQFSTNDGDDWSPLGAVSNSNARLLASDSETRLRFVPNPNFSGQADFTFRAWDQTAGTNGGTASAAINGGSSSFSSGALETVSITVTPVNDPPVAENGSVAATEDTPSAITLAASDIDSPLLTYSIISGPDHGVLSGSGANPTYTPALNYQGADSFTFRVSDGTSNSNVATVSIAVAAVNDAPVASDRSVSTAEGAPVTITLQASDVEGSALSYAAVAGSGPTEGVLSGTSDGDNQVTYTPNAGATGADSFRYLANDGSLDSNEATVSIDIASVNEAPAATNDAYSASEDGTLVVNATSGVLANDVDGDGDPLTAVFAAGPAHGTLSLQPNGSFTYAPAADYYGPDAFTYRADDGSLTSDLATVSITVTSVNDAPTAAGQSVSTAEDTAKAITLSGGDVDGDALSFVVEQPLHGTVSGTGANKTYTPAANYNGPDSFTFRTDDGTVQSAAATVSITVTSVSDAPTAAGQSVSTAEDTAKAITLSGGDVDGDALSFVVQQPLHGTLSGTGANRTYTPAENYNGPDSFTFRTDDGTAQSAAATVSITVTAVNDPPAASNVSATTLEDTPKVFSLAGTDVDGDAISYLAVDLPEHGVVTADGQEATYTPDADYNGPDSFTYRTSDGEAQSSLATVSLTVTPMNDAPVADDAGALTDEDQAVTIPLTASDVDGDPLAFSLVDGPSSGGAVITGSDAVYTPEAEFGGEDSFTFRVTDGTLQSGLATVYVTVNALNDPPVPVDDDVTTAEDESVTITLAATDVEGDPVSFTVPPEADHGSLTPLGADQVVYTPEDDYFGPDSFSFTASDGTGEANGLISLSVTPVNDAPALDASGSPLLSPVNANASDPAGDTVADILASGAGGDPITDIDPDDQEGIAVVAADAASGTWQYDPTGAAGWSSLDGASQSAARLLTPEAEIRFVPAAGFTGSASIEFQAWDQTQGFGGGSADTTLSGGSSPFSIARETASIEVTPVVNQAPVPADDVVDTNEDTPINIDVLDNDSDPDGDTLSIVDITTPDDGTAEIDLDGTVLYQPDPDTNGTDRFVYTVEDGEGGSATAEVDVTVLADNDIPTARDDVERVSEDGMVVFDPTVNDIAGPLDESGGPITITGVTGAPANGTAEVPSSGPDAGKVRYTPDPGYQGADVFQYEICDDGTPAFCAEATVDMTVSRVSATVETAAVPHAGSVGTDAADDPAIWVHPTNAAQSVVIATNKFSDGSTNGGLLVYDLQGNQLQYTNDGRMNNVDLRDGFPLGGEEVTIVTSTERNGGNLVLSPKRIWVYKLDHSTRTLAPIHRVAPIVAGFEPLGTCIYRSPSTDDFYVFVTGANGVVEQWRLFEGAGGLVDAAKVRTFTVPDASAPNKEIEGCVADEETGALYIGEEDVAIWKYSAEPDGGTARTQVDVTGGGHLVADIEGLTIAYGPGDTGYLIASSQGNNAYSVYRREGDNEFVRRFKIKDGATVDGTSETDGIDVTTASLGPEFPNGVFVAQDNSNSPGLRQNYKLVPLEELFETGGLGANGSCARPYADSSPWNTPIDFTAAVHPDSVEHVGAITGPLRSDPSQYTYPVYMTDPGTPLETVAIEGWYSNVTNGGRTLANQRAGTAQIPIPAGAVAAAGGDAQLVVLDPRTGDEWGLSHAEQDATGAWSAWNVYHYNTRWSAVPPYDASGKPFFPRGAGLPYLAGLVRPCELERGRIDHALAFAYDFPTAEFVYPATKSDGDSAGFPDMPEGSRLQLNPALSAADLASLGCTGHCLTIARALQQYGMYIIDNSGRPKVMLEFEGTAAWGGAVNSSTVSPIPLSAFQLLER